MAFNLSSEEYIGTLEPERLANAVVSKMQNWNSSIETSGMMSSWRQNYQLYYGTSTHALMGASTSYGIVGDYGEYMALRVNHYRNVLTHILNMLYARPRTFKAGASNTTPEALNQATLYDAIHDYTMKIKRVNRQYRKSGESAIIFGTGAALVEWDTMKGAPFASDENQLYHTGDLRVRAKTPFDFFTDLQKTEWEDVEWVIVRDYVNKFILAANFPDMYDRIMKLKRNQWMTETVYFTDVGESDDVPVYKFYHKQVPGLLPNGRFTMILDKDLIAYDGDNPYGELPLLLVKPSDWFGTFYGYTIANDIAPIQMFYDLLGSSVATTVAAYGIPSIIGYTGSDIQPTELIGGMKYLQVDPGMQLPQALNFETKTPENIQLMQLLERLVETISGVNSVIRGNPETSLKSGVALDIVKSQAIQFMSWFDKSISDFEQDANRHILKIYKKMPNSEQIVSIVGKDRIYEIKRWARSDIQYVDNMYLEEIDPVAKTIEGNQTRANLLLERGIVKTPEEYFTVIDTGRVEPMYRSESNELKTIRLENSKLMLGEIPQAIKEDNHPLHKAEHKIVLADPDTRADPNIMNAVAQHLAHHDELEMLVAKEELVKQQEMQAFSMLLQGQMAPPEMMGLPPGPGGPPMTQSMEGPPPGQGPVGGPMDAVPEQPQVPVQ